MRTHVADIPVASVPEPMPVVLEAQRIERTHGRRAQEFVPIHPRGHGAVGCMSNGEAPLEADGLGQIYLADDTLLEQADSPSLMLHATAVRSYLHHALGLAPGVHPP